MRTRWDARVPGRRIRHGAPLSRCHQRADGVRGRSSPLSKYGADQWPTHRFKLKTIEKQIEKLEKYPDALPE